MDIRRWLAEIENPVPCKQSDLAHISLPDPASNVRRIRKQTPSDSSLLEETSPQLRPRRTTKVERECRDVEGVVGSGRSGTSQPSRSKWTNSIASSERFARRRRHKTRSDKYDPRSKRSTKHDESRSRRRKSESSKSKRKSQRKSKRQGVERTHNGIGQEFWARNVTRDRLTVSVWHTQRMLAS